MPAIKLRFSKVVSWTPLQTYSFSVDHILLLNCETPYETIRSYRNNSNEIEPIFGQFYETVKVNNRIKPVMRQCVLTSG